MRDLLHPNKKMVTNSSSDQSMSYKISLTSNMIKRNIANRGAQQLYVMENMPKFRMEHRVTIYSMDNTFCITFRMEHRVTIANSAVISWCLNNSSKNLGLFQYKNLLFFILRNHFSKILTSDYLFYTLFYLNNHLSFFYLFIYYYLHKQ